MSLQIVGAVEDTNPTAYNNADYLFNPPVRGFVVRDDKKVFIKLATAFYLCLESHTKRLVFIGNGLDSKERFWVEPADLAKVRVREIRTQEEKD